MTERAIRVVAVGVVRRARHTGRATGGREATEQETDGETPEELLVERHRDPESDETFYRPLGGGVEFGERGEEALRREFREELGVELAGVFPVETYEDVFTFDGEIRHEVWRVYETDIVEDWPYEREEFTAREPDTGEEIECVWKSVADFEDGDTLYPEALPSAL
ncbi:NUDIX domain-containing protein [Halorussus aquaticus]|uniref:NUDIX domain-containing protein n=1 Tax=Halorussus aquaticus TaxID=2953748 RepID=A0ABD5Q4N3_9EURY|nr:NUDIX domain-containing protein [Halorussus aquaticus]